MESAVASYDVVQAVAQQEGVSPGELSPPLFSVLDPDALDTLVRGTSSATQVTVEFTYLGYVVRIENGQTVSISNRDESTAETESVTEE